MFTLPARIAALAYYNKAVFYALHFDVAAEILLALAPIRSDWVR